MADSWRQINLLEVKVIELNYVSDGKFNEVIAIQAKTIYVHILSKSSFCTILINQGVLYRVKNHLCADTV